MSYNFSQNNDIWKQVISINKFKNNSGSIQNYGPTGSIGTTGAVGPTGDIGPKGDPGSASFTGAQGPTGSQGAPGFSTGAIYYLNNDIPASDTTNLPIVNAISSGGTGYTGPRDLNRLVSSNILQTNVEKTFNGTNILLQNFVTPIGDPNITELSGGSFNFEIYADTTAASASFIFFRVYLYHLDTTVTLISESAQIPLVVKGVPYLYLISSLITPRLIDITDRFYIEILGTSASGNKTITLYFNDNTIGQVTTTLNPFKSGPTGPTGPQGLKTFIIDHPDNREKYLVHGCLEGPEAGVYYRGKGSITNNYLEILLPDYVKNLAKNLTVNVTPKIVCEYEEKNITIPILAVSDIVDNKFKVFSNIPCDFNWIVFGKRQDIEIEPLKSDVSLKGNGPYLYL